MCRIVLHHLLFPPEGVEAPFYYYERASPRRIELIRQVLAQLRHKDGLQVHLIDRLEPTDLVLRPWYAPSIHGHERIIEPPPVQAHRFFSHFYRNLGPIPWKPSGSLFRRELFELFKTKVLSLGAYEELRTVGEGGTHLSFWFSLNALDLYECIQWVRNQSVSEDFVKQLCWMLHCRMNHVQPSYEENQAHWALAQRWAQGLLKPKDVLTETLDKEQLVRLSNRISLEAQKGPMPNAHRLVMSQVCLVHLGLPWWYGARAWQTLNIDFDPAANGYNWFLQSRSRFIRNYATLRRLKNLPPIEAYGLKR